ncbi:MAG TPA: class I SAM-dependent methyltransferase [Clostridia bacterium]|nr:class I SAM-dependent methyltransferase [Clostridia bacterium]
MNPQDEIRAYYEDETMLPFLTRFVGLFAKPPRILEMGCGAGYDAMRLRRLGAEVVGVDLSARSIAIARERNPDIPFHVLDFRSLPAGLGAFDGIVACASLIHLPGEALPDVFARMRQTLRKGGYALVVFLEGNGFSERRSLREHNGKQYNRHVYLHEKTALAGAAARAGLELWAEWFEEPAPEGKLVWTHLVLRAV